MFWFALAGAFVAVALVYAGGYMQGWLDGRRVGWWEMAEDVEQCCGARARAETGGE